LETPEVNDQQPEKGGCFRADCTGRTQAAVPLWLNREQDGSWSVYGVGNEIAAITCEHGHRDHRPDVAQSLRAFLEDLLPRSTGDSATEPTDGCSPGD
jgi:hypothetical protein